MDNEGGIHARAEARRHRREQLRDYFAAHALSDKVFDEILDFLLEGNVTEAKRLAEHAAHAAYVIANAMVRER